MTSTTDPIWTLLTPSASIPAFVRFATATALRTTSAACAALRAISFTDTVISSVAADTLRTLSLTSVAAPDASRARLRVSDDSRPIRSVTPEISPEALLSVVALEDTWAMLLLRLISSGEPACHLIHRALSGDLHGPCQVSL